MRITKRAAVVLMVLLYGVVACALAVVVGHFNVPRYWRMLNDGRATRATVLRTACGNHGSVFYRFEASGREYTGVGNAGFGTPECGQLKPETRWSSTTFRRTPTSPCPVRSGTAGTMS